MSEVQILVISNTLDFSTDYVCVELDRRGSNYFRLNRDLLSTYKIVYDVLAGVLTINADNSEYVVTNNTLKSVYYRAPIYLRDIYSPDIPPETQLSRTQWMSFVRNLTTFDAGRWVNHPTSTFRAENKLLQLRMASKVGLNCPNTIVTNCVSINLDDTNKKIVKSLDTAILRIGDKEAFVYSNVVDLEEISSFDNSTAPIVVQTYIQPKIDVRVTVIGEVVHAVKIMKNGEGVAGDWRRIKDDIDFIPFELPSAVRKMCTSLVKALGLHFGGIDLIESNGSYYFIEVNPTGEWGWLVNSAQLPIPETMCDFLVDV